MARLYSCGFELGLATREVTSTQNILVSPTTVRTGIYSGRVNAAAAAVNNSNKTQSVDLTGQFYQRAYINIASAPSNNTTGILSFVSGSGGARGGELLLTSASTLRLIKADGTQLGADSGPLSAGTWYRLEIGMDTSAATLEGRINGFAFASGSNSSAGAAGNFYLTRGAVTPFTTTCDLYFDDWGVNDGTGSSQNSWLGDSQIIMQLPTGAGDSTQFAIGGTVPAATNWQGVSEIPSDDGVSFNSSNTLNQSDMFTVGSTSIGVSDVVNVVQVGFRLNGVGNTSSTIKPQIEKSSGGTILQGTGFLKTTNSFLTNDPSWNTTNAYPLTAYTDPDGAAWIKSTIESMQIGYKVTTSGTNIPQITALWAMVDYTPSTVSNHRGVFGNYGHYASVGNGMSRSEVAN